MARIGVFGGTFDPIHYGHLAAAVNARHAAGLDQVLLVVANLPWQKEGDRDLTSAVARFGLVREAVVGVAGLEASDIEIIRGGTSYTIDTLVELREKSAEDEYFLIVGADAAAGITSWERCEDLPKFARLVVVNRPGHPKPSNIGEFDSPIFAEIPSLAISSTDIRQRVADGRPLEYLLPPGAVEYIRRNGLYRVGSRLYSE